MASSPTSPSRKRTYDGEPVMSSGTSLTPVKAVESSSGVQRSVSPSLSTASSLTDLTPSMTQSPELNSAQPAPVTKKRKLTAAEKIVEQAVRRREKEEKLKLKAEEKTRKEDEKRAKDDERRRKEEEKEASKRARELEVAEKKAARDAAQQTKDAKKQEKEAEKARREAEKLKKERTQMRLGNFFSSKQNAASTPSSTPEDISSGASSRRSSITSIDMDRPIIETSKKSIGTTNAAFEAWILPFKEYVQDDTDYAPQNRFYPHGKANLCGGVFEKGAIPVDDYSVHLEPVHQRFRRNTRHVRWLKPVREVMDRIHGSSTAPIDLTSDDKSSTFRPLDQYTYKFIGFCENVRPPYIGTFVKKMSLTASHKLSRQPTYRGLPNTDYEYDSEAEWEAPADDDEDLENDDDESVDEDGEDEMADFLDDENDQTKRKAILGDMQPVSSGLVWCEEVDHCEYAFRMQDYQMDVLQDSTRFPIDPHSSVYWPTSSSMITPKPQSGNAHLNVMQPPRLPLSAVSAPNVSPSRPSATISGLPVSTPNENTAPVSAQAACSSQVNKPIKMISNDLLPAFKAAVDGSDLTKAGLVEILKKQFPKCSKDAIKDTLSAIAVRKGAKEADKKWVLIT